ncbi:MAG: Spy/CpxP family protein refolding chaperone [Myxococcota bacterium]
MKRNILFAVLTGGLLSLAVPTVSLAQGPARAESEASHQDRGRRGPRARHHIRRMARHLDLTDAQKAELRSIMQTRRAEARAWREANPEATREERRAFRQAMRTEMQSTIATILTPEQLAKVAEHRANREARRDARRGTRRGPGTR